MYILEGGQSDRAAFGEQRGQTCRIHMTPGNGSFPISDGCERTITIQILHLPQARQRSRLRPEAVLTLYVSVDTPVCEMVVIVFTTILC